MNIIKPQPIPSIGTVAQLAADGLISQYGMELVGYLDCKYHVPVVGGQDSGYGISTAVDVFHSAKYGITIVLQRSPPLRAQADKFASELAAWTVSMQFKDIIVLTGIAAETRTDAELQQSSSLIRTWCRQEKDRTLCDQFDVPRYVGNIPSRAGEEGEEEAAIPIMPHSGTASRITMALYEKRGDAARICIVGMFMSATDIEAAKVLASTVARGLGMYA